QIYVCGMTAISSNVHLQLYLTNLINKIINSNLEISSEYPNRPEKVQKFIIGNVMKETKSQANPKITAEIVIKILYNKK
ncbi:MAG: hypothetical protein K2N40_01510, partial [Ureaplasma sp.]|nr:hypothetical protein [Ureaplasma sp.]